MIPFANHWLYHDMGMDGCSGGCIAETVSRSRDTQGFGVRTCRSGEYHARTWCSSAKREISFLFQLLRVLTRITYTTHNILEHQNSNTNARTQVRRVPEGIENFDRWFGVYPLLLFPIRVYKRNPRDS